MAYIRLLMGILIFTLFMACNETPCKNGVKGTIKDLKGLDGCGMVILLENDITLIPLNLEDFELDQLDGQEVILSYTIEQDAMGICMTGEMVTIDCLVIK